MLLKHVSDYEVVLETEITKEETQESIVPDISPDVAGVVYTGGVVSIREKEIRESEISVSGSVRVTALCRPETTSEAMGSGALCRLECAIPFAHTFTGGTNRNNGRVAARAWVERTSARVLNPRKVLFSVTIGIAITAWQPRERSLCVGLLSEDDVPEVLRGGGRLYLPCAVCEKPFHISEDWEIPAGKPPVGEILHTALAMTAGDCKPVGSKLVFKGEARLSMLYAAAGMYEELVHLEHVVPFSQIMEIDTLEGGSLDEDCDIDLALIPTGFELLAAGGIPGEARSLGIEIQALATMAASTEQEVAPISDAYSVKYELNPVVGQFDAPELMERGERRAAVREVFDIPSGVGRVIMAEAAVCSVGAEESDGQLAAAAQLSVRVMYFGEDGMPYSMEGMIKALTPYEFPTGAVLRASASIEGEVYAAPTAGGVEIRCTVGFAVTVVKPVNMDVLVDVSGTPVPRDMTGRPSVVLRPVDAGESLWDVAKAYGSSVSGICRVNGLDPGAVLDNSRTLLIPKGQ
jgi:hypothetical protein